MDNNSAVALNLGAEKIEDILILHLENGKDFFISITGDYLVTCFGMSLNMLVRLPDPVRKSAGAIVAYQRNPRQLPKLSVPKELWRMMDYIFQHGCLAQVL